MTASKYFIYGRIRVTNKKQSQTGFTLLELVVVVFILGILSAIMLPNMIAQVGKAREAEAKEFLSSIGFAQQGYFWEHGQFASDYYEMGLTFDSKYYDISPPETPPNAYRTKSQAIAKGGGQNYARNYALGVYFVNNSYRINLCQSTNPQTITQAPDTVEGDCTGGQKIY
jgi:type IV pilus assembly protein PilA